MNHIPTPTTAVIIGLAGLCFVAYVIYDYVIFVQQEHATASAQANTTAANNYWTEVPAPVNGYVCFVQHGDRQTTTCFPDSVSLKNPAPKAN